MKTILIYFILAIASVVVINYLIGPEPDLGQRWMRPGANTFEPSVQFEIVEVRYPWLKIRNQDGQTYIVHRDTVARWILIPNTEKP